MFAGSLRRAIGKSTTGLSVANRYLCQSINQP
jgi:hypothetical protein